jgi:membrane-bound serine protease (ClpP class)
MAMSVERRVDQVLAMTPRPRFAIFDLDTWGGEVGAAFDIADRIGKLDQNVTAVAYVSEKAISAGALIAISCDSIAMRPNTRIGDCEPITVGKDGTIETLPEKMVTVIREHFRSYAEQNGYPVALAIAMVDKSDEVLRITSEPDGGGKPVQTYVLGREFAEWPVEKKARAAGRETVVATGQLLTMNHSRAKEYGFARWVVDDVPDLVRRLEAEAGTPLVTRRIETSAWEDFVAFLNSPEVKTALMMIGILGILIELKAPGILIPGAIGVGCLALAFFGGYLAGLAEVIEIVLVLIGFGLLAVELFLIPGFGITGIAGIVCIAVGMVLSLQSFDWPETQWEFGKLRENVLSFFVGLTLAVGLFLLSLRFLPETRLLSRLVLSAKQKAEDGYTVASSARVALLGRVAVAATPLRPAGKIDLEDERLDAVAEGEFIEKGEKVEIVETDENRLVVRRPEPKPAAAQAAGGGSAA